MNKYVVHFLACCRYTVEYGLWGRGAGVSWWGTEYAAGCSGDECAGFWDDQCVDVVVVVVDDDDDVFVVVVGCYDMNLIFSSRPSAKMLLYSSAVSKSVSQS